MSSSNDHSRPTTGDSAVPPVPRATFLLPRRSDEQQDESPAITPAALPTANPFSPPGTPSLGPSSRVHSTASVGQIFYPASDIVHRSSGILSQGSSAIDLPAGAHARSGSRVTDPFSSGRSNISGASTGDITEEPRPGYSRAGSTLAREAFSSPPLRPLTSMYIQSTNGSTAAVAPPKVKRAKSTMLTGEIEKPWTKEKDKIGRVAYFLTYAFAFLGVAASAVRIYFGYTGVPKFKHPLCPVLEDNFDTLDTNIWEHENKMSGFGNGQFEMTTDSPNNSFVRDGMLYIMPTLTSDVIGTAAIMNNHIFNLTDCSSANYTDCSAVSNSSTGAVINPAMSARLITKNSHSIRFGKVEVRAKLPRGDWLWPAIWMLPKDNFYGEWPISGEIDLMESRGNGPKYPKQGRNYVRGSLNWGPITWLNAVYKTYGWWTTRRSSYDEGFHTYTLEWTEEWMRIYVDTRLHHMLDIRFNKPFWKRGNFPPVVTNGTNQVVLTDPWTPKASVPNAAPFDQQFYLILNVAVGGTNGWFPDNAGGKMWLDNSATAMRDFAQAQDEWYATWPQGDQIDDRAMIVDYVKMWSQC